jgi:hypothetical protein
MTADFSPPPPIVVDSGPGAEQLAAGIRQAILVLASIATALGYTKAAGEISAFLLVAGPLAGFIVIVAGQWKTRDSAQKKAAMAAQLPDSVAVVKS